MQSSTSALMVLALLASAQSGAYRAEIQTHRAEREAALRADDGWLAVAGLFWLRPGANTAGSDPSSNIVLPRKAPARLGVFVLEGGRLRFTADASARVTVGGKAVREAGLDPAAGARDAIVSGDLVMFAIRRDDQHAIRMRDLNSTMRRSFKGLEYFPIRPEYRVVATFTPHARPTMIPILNVLGQTPEMESPGSVTFTLGGRRLRLEPVYETNERKDLFFIFKDLTSRDKTYPAGRYLHAPLPKDGKVDLDFNKAYNPPCAFTDFATCPLPPKQNQLQIRIEAGELAYHGPTREEKF